MKDIQKRLIIMLLEENAKNRYKEILSDRKDDMNYRGYDKRVLIILTKDLGHNRLDVVIYNYLK